MSRASRMSSTATSVAAARNADVASAGRRSSCDVVSEFLAGPPQQSRLTGLRSRRRRARSTGCTLIGLGIALQYIGPQLTLLAFGLIIGIGILAATPVLLRSGRAPGRARLPPPAASRS